MGVLDRIVNDKKLLLGTVVIILLAATLVRVYHIEWSFSNNGIDEGIMIQRARLVGDGYALYSELPCDQAPLAFYLGAPFGGDVVSLRTISAAMSVLAILAVMEAARRAKGNLAMLAAGLLLTIDFAFLRESRLFSLDGISASFLAFSLLPFIIYIQKRSRTMLASAGLLVGLSAATKLFGVLGLLGMIIFILLEGRREKSPFKGRLTDAIIVVVFSAIPLAAFMAYLGPGDLLQGMVLDQGGRSFELWLKLSLLAYFGLNLAYVVPLVYAKRTWSMGKEARFLLCVSGVILAFMVFQPLVFFHHLPLMSPALAVLAAAFLSDIIGNKKVRTRISSEKVVSNKRDMTSMTAVALFCVTILASAGLAGYGLLAQDEPPQVELAGTLEAITDDGDWIICGDPLICAYADRDIPPDMVNVAYRQHQDLTLDDIEQVISEYNVSVVVLSWRLLELDGVSSLLFENDFALLEAQGSSRFAGYHAVLDFFQKDMGPVYVYWRQTQ